MSKITKKDRREQRRKRKERGYEKERGKEKGMKSLIFLIDNALPRCPYPFFLGRWSCFLFLQDHNHLKKILSFTLPISTLLLFSFPSILQEDVFSLSRLVSLLLPSISSLSASLWPLLLQLTHLLSNFNHSVASIPPWAHYLLHLKKKKKRKKGFPSMVV